MLLVKTRAEVKSVYKEKGVIVVKKGAKTTILGHHNADCMW